jgi:autotransporter-associated beta strand protein
VEVGEKSCSSWGVREGSGLGSKEPELSGKRAHIMSNRGVARIARDIGRSSFTLNSKNHRLQKAADAVIEALESRWLLTSYVWHNLSSASASWNADANWSPDTSYPHTAVDSANLNVNVATNQAISLGANISLTSLTLGDSALSGGSGPTQTIDAGSGGQGITFYASGSASLTLAADAVGGVAVAAPIALNSNLTIANNSSQTLTISGNIAMRGHSITVTGSGPVVLSGRVYSAGNAELIKQGSGTLTLSGGADNAYLILNAEAGTTILSKASSGGVHAVASIIDIAAGATVQSAGTGVNQIYENRAGVSNGLTLAGGTFDLAGRSENVDFVLGSGTITDSAPATTSILTVGTAGGSGTFDGAIVNGCGTIALTKIGAGTLTLAGSNTYTGATTVSAGTLRVDGSLAASAVSVDSGATLDGTGTIAGPVSVASAGILAPGNAAPGSLTTGSLSLASGANFDSIINGTSTGTFGQVDVSGNVSLSGAHLNLTGTRTNHAADVLPIISNAGTSAITGTFASLAQGATVTVNGVNYLVSYTGGSGSSMTLTNAGLTVATAAAASPSPVTGTTAALSVLGADALGESHITYTWATTGTPPAAVTFSANGANAAKNTTATFTKAGTYNFQVTLTDTAGLSTASSVSVTVNQTLTSIAVSPATTGVAESHTAQFSAVAKDQFGNALTTQPTFTWSVPTGIGSVNSSGLYTAPGSTGTATVKAVSGSVNGTASVTVATAPTVATAAAASLSSDGTTVSLSVLGADAAGASNLTYTWAATSMPSGATAPIFSDGGDNTAQNTLAFPSQAGNYTFQATITNAAGLSTTSSVTLDVTQVATSITVNPDPPVLAAGGSQTFTASELDQFGNAMSSQPSFTWSVESGGEGGTINSSGHYTAGTTAGVDAIDAVAGSLTGTGEASVVTAVPAQPTGLTATAAENSVVLSWDEQDDAATYNVYRGTSSGGESATPIATGLTDPTYTDTGRTNGTTYYYTIKAVNPLGTGSASSEASTAPAPVAPADVTATPGDDQIIVSWDPAIGATGYNVYRSTSSGGEGSTPYQTDLTGTSFTDAQSTANPYYYTVQAIYSSGGGTISSEVSASAEVAAPPAPSALTAAANGSDEIDLSWSAGTSAGGPTDQYIIERSTDGTNFSEYDEVDGSQTAYQDTDVNDGATYYYEVCAANSVGNSASTSSANAYTPLAAPDELEADAVSSTEIDLSWENNSATATGFIVQRSTNGGAFATVGTISGNTTTSFDDTGLSPGTSYNYQVIATLGSAASAASDPDSALTFPASLSGLTATAASSSEVDLSWTDVTGAAGYEIDQKDASGNWEEIDAVDSSADSYADTGLSDGTAYTYQVIPYNDSGEADGSNPSASATTPLIAPANVDAVALSSTSVEIVWDNQSSSETGFSVQPYSNGSAIGSPANVAAGTTDYVFSSATANTAYDFAVEATNTAAGSSAASTSNLVTTPAAPLPGPQAATLTATSVTSSSATLVTSAVPAGTLVVLEVEAPGVPNYQEVTSGESYYGNPVTFNVGGLDSGDQYEFRVRSETDSSSGEGGVAVYGSPLQVNTPAYTAAAGAPVAPTIVSATPVYDQYGNEYLSVVLSGDYASSDEFNVSMSMPNDPYSDVILGSGGSESASDALGSDGDYHLPWVWIGTASGPVMVDVTAGNGSAISPVVSQETTLAFDSRSNVPVCTPTLTLTPLDNGTGQMQLTWTGAPTDTEYSDWQYINIMVGSPDGHSSTYVTTPISETVNPDGTGSAVIGPQGVGSWFFLHTVGGDYVSNLIQQPVIAPVAPAGLQATPIDTSSGPAIGLVWDDESNNETGFTIQRSTAGDFSANLQTYTVAADVTTYTDTTAVPGVTYYYRVEATNSAGTSAFDNAEYPASLPLSTVSVTALDPDANAEGPDGNPQDGYFDFHRTGDLTGNLTVNVSDTGTTAVAGTDYSGSLPTTVTFPAGQQDVIVPVTPTSNDPDLSTIADASIATGDDYTNATGEAQLDLVGAGPTVKLGNGSDNIVLQGSNNGMSNLQQLHLNNLPSSLPAGGNITLTLLGDAASDVVLWNSATPTGPGNQISMTTATTIVWNTLAAIPSSIYVGAIHGSQAVNDIYFTVKESVPANGSAPPEVSDSPPSNAATAVKVSIDLLSNPNGADGDITGWDPEWLVGQMVDLEADIQAPPGWAIPNLEDFQWTVPGNVARAYEISTDGAKIEPLLQDQGTAEDEYTGTGTQKQEIKFFWESISSVGGGPDSDPVSLTANVDGNSFAASTDFQVYSATFDNPRVSVGSPQLINQSGPDITLAMNSAPSSLSYGYGMYIQGSVTLPDAFTTGGFSSGSWEYVQTVSEQEWWSDGPGLPSPHFATGGFVLDTYYPEGGFIFPDLTTTDVQTAAVGGSPPVVMDTHDEPSNNVHGEDQSPLYRNDAFMTYVMFLPPGVDSQWVPLRVLSWGFHATVTAVVTGPQQYKFTLVNPGSYGGPATLTRPTAPPTWTGNVKDPEVPTQS